MRPKLLGCAVMSLMFFVCWLFACQKATTDTSNRPNWLTSVQALSIYASADANTAYNYEPVELEMLKLGWIKSFEDKFDNNDPSIAATSKLNQWNIWTGGAFNNELQYYQPPNLQVENSNLIITAKKEMVTGPTYPVDQTPKDFEFTSARMETKVLFSANSKTPKVRIAARIKLPRGSGIWPAFWIYGDPWPTEGEIDILEARGQEPYKYETNYFYGKTANVNLVNNEGGFITADENLQEGFHVYELLWTKNELNFYLDGRLIETKTGGYVSNLFGKKEKITLDVAVGGNFFVNLAPTLIQTGTVDGVEYGKMYVDWVKVFTSK